MLATIREYGLVARAASWESSSAPAMLMRPTTWRSLSAPNLALAGAEQGSWAEQLERDHVNIRVAMQRLLDHGEIEKRCG